MCVLEVSRGGQKFNFRVKKVGENQVIFTRLEAPFLSLFPIALPWNYSLTHLVALERSFFPTFLHSVLVPAFAFPAAFAPFFSGSYPVYQSDRRMKERSIFRLDTLYCIYTLEHTH